MKLIEPSVELIEQEPGIEGIYKQIEVAARLCYKSEDKITEDSAKKFVDMLINNGHGAMLEHGTVYMEVPIEHWREDEHEWVYMFPDKCPWVSLDCDGDWMYITTNFRHILNGDVGETLMKQYMCEPTKNHEKRYTLKFTTSIGITRELIRHRHFSFANESTRYCNYSKDKFGGEITFVKPTWVNIPSELSEGTMLKDGLESWFNPNYIHIYCRDVKSKWFMKACLEAEYSYLHVINEQNATPQEAREVLPLCTKSEIIMTGFESDWKDFLRLRCAKNAHPDIQYLANRVMDILKIPQIKIE